MHRPVGVFALLLAAVVAAPVAAQTAVLSTTGAPDNGTVAVGASLGVAVPGEDAFKTGWSLGVYGERYFSPRLALRAQLTGTWWDISGLQDDGNASPVSVTGNVVYNWQRGRLRPYGTGGVGIYKFRFTEDDFDSSETQLGLNVGGGVEFALRERHIITGEMLIHSVAGSADSLFNDYTPWFWSVSVGYKRYF